MIQLERDGNIAELRFQHTKPLNPFTRSMTRELIKLCGELEADDAVSGVLLWGGEGRSFSVGGDFTDIRLLKKEDDVKDYLREIVRSYQAVLNVSKPVVAAVDFHAIGQGLQVALMCDWRVGSDRSLYRMPELANGVACPLGSRILESLIGRAAMLHLVIGCDGLDAQGAHGYRLIDDICAPSSLKSAALARLSAFCGYPQVAYRLTKEIHNARFCRELDLVCEAAAQAHAGAFLKGQADAHFAKILGERS